MKSISKDARGFVEGIVDHLNKSGKVRDATPRIQTLLLKMTSNARKEHQAKVESAVKLTATETLLISRILSRIAGHEVGLVSVENPALIGGLRVTMADWVMDLSIRNELREMASIVTI